VDEEAYVVNSFNQTCGNEKHSNVVSLQNIFAVVWKILEENTEV